MCLHKLTSRKWFIQSACATTGEGIYEAMKELSSMVKEYKKGRKWNQSSSVFGGSHQWSAHWLLPGSSIPVYADIQNALIACQDGLIQRRKLMQELFVIKDKVLVSVRAVTMTEYFKKLYCKSNVYSFYHHWLMLSTKNILTVNQTMNMEGVWMNSLSYKGELLNPKYDFFIDHIREWNMKYLE